MRPTPTLVFAMVVLLLAPSAVGGSRGTDVPFLRYREHYGHVKVRCRDLHGVLGDPEICDVATSGRWRLKARLPLDATDVETWSESTPVVVRVGDRSFDAVFGDDTRLRLQRRKVRLARGTPKTRLVVRWNRRGVNIELRQRLGFFGKGRLEPPARTFVVRTDADIVVGASRASFELPLRAQVFSRAVKEAVRERLYGIEIKGRGKPTDS